MVDIAKVNSRTPSVLVIIFGFANPGRCPGLKLANAFGVLRTVRDIKSYTPERQWRTL
jgi:hypothetical protein